MELREQQAVHRILADEKPAQVYLAAAKVGGIHANNAYKADFLYDNLVMQANVIEGSRLAGVEKLLFWAVHAFIPSTLRNPWGKTPC